MTRAIIPSEAKIIDTFISDHKLTLTKVGKSPRKTVQLTKQILSDVALKSFFFTPLAFVDMERDITIMREETKSLHAEAFQTITRKIKPKNTWYDNTALVQLRHEMSHVMTLKGPENSRIDT